MVKRVMGLLPLLVLCSLFNLTLSQSCVCPEGYECRVLGGGIQYCDRIQTTTDTPPVESSTVAATETRINDACDIGYQRPSSDEGDSGCSMFCMFGICRLTVEGQQYCHCDPNASGSVCMTKCCKQCGEYGRWVAQVGGVEVCACADGYEGEACDISSKYILFNLLPSHR